LEQNLCPKVSTFKIPHKQMLALKKKSRAHTNVILKHITGVLELAFENA